MGTLGDIRIAFIGGGTMAEAFLRGLLGKELCTPTQLVASDPLPQRREHLTSTLGIQAVSSNKEAIAGAGIVVLAVKPQVLSAVLEELAWQIAPETLVLSIVTGATIERIRTALGTKAVVRIMPNTPGQIGEGISVWTATPETSVEQRAQAQQIISALGEEVYVEHEDYLDMATALSGSGPAYVFLFIEALIDAGVRMGFSRAMAEKLALQTVRGAAIFAQRSGKHPAILRNMVTSPGGTTAEALYHLEKGGFRALISQAIWAAYEKAKYLGELDK